MSVLETNIIWVRITQNTKIFSVGKVCRQFLDVKSGGTYYIADFWTDRHTREDIVVLSFLMYEGK
jgi:hypothetical protein